MLAIQGGIGAELLLRGAGAMSDEAKIGYIRNEVGVHGMWHGVWVLV